MKYAIVLLVLVGLACADNFDSIRFEKNTAYGYHTRFGIPEAERIRKIEENYEHSRIAGGVPAAVGQYPYKAGIIGDIIGMNALSVCGGALITTSRVTTAAHCWFDGTHQAWRFTIVLGSALLFSGGTRLTTSAVASHPNWSPLLTRNDLAVVYLANEVVTSANIAPIALPTGSELFENFAGQAATAVGFGATGDNNPITTGQTLAHVRLNVITNTVCTLAFPLIIQSSHICTSGAGGVGICGGDSGAPLVITSNNEPILHGKVTALCLLVSTVQSKNNGDYQEISPPAVVVVMLACCSNIVHIGVSSFRSATGCQGGMPSVFSRVTSYIDFLNQHM